MTWGAHNCDELEELLEADTVGEAEAEKVEAGAAKDRSSRLNEL